MGDPFSVAASLIAVLQISGTVISYCYDYRQGLKSASKDLWRVTAEVKSLRNVLERLVALVDDDSNSDSKSLPALTDISFPNGPLDVCQRELQSLTKKLERPVSDWKALGRRLVWPLQSKDVSRTMEVVHRTKSILETALLVDNTASMIEIRDTTRDMGERLLDFTRSKALIPETTSKLVLDWLNGPDPSIKHRALRETCGPETGKWFLEREEYTSWQTEAISCIWLNGIPGCGKSVLCSTIIEDIAHKLDREQRSIILHYYFDFANKVDSSELSLLRSLVTQLEKQAAKVPKEPRESKRHTFFNDWQKRLTSTTAGHVAQPSSTELLDVLFDSIGEFDDFYIVLDGLDESVERREVLTLLERITISKAGRIHILVASRYDVDIEERLLPLTTGYVHIENHLIEPDIRLHIKQQLQSNPKLQKWPQKAKERMEATLIAGSEGMFRWTACQLEVLSRCKTLKQFEATLKALPKDLMATYQRVLDSLDPESYEMMNRLLRWVAVAPRPIRLDEAVDFLAIDEGNGKDLVFDPDMRLFDPNDILTMCTGLVSVSRKSIIIEEEACNPKHDIRVLTRLCQLLKQPDTIIEELEIRLSHSSVKDFLMLHFSEQVLPPFGITTSLEAYVAERCLAYLLYFQVPFQERNEIHNYPLARYAAEWWMHHVQRSQSRTSPLGAHLMQQLMDDTSVAFSNWIRLYDPDRPWRDVDVSRERHTSALYYASQMGLEHLVDYLLKVKAKPNRGRGRFGTPLKVAAYNGHLSVAEKLLIAGACPNTASGMFYSPLNAAAAQGHVDMVPLLIKHGANLNMSTITSGTALLQATKNRHSKVTKVLIEEGQADVSVVCDRKGSYSYGCNPLEVASRLGDIEIVSQILPKASNRVIATGLREASWNKSRELLELYVKFDPDGVLYYAAESGWADMVTRILKDSGTITALPTQGAGENSESSPLVAAAAAGHESIVRGLISNKADVNSISHERYALESAAAKGFGSIVNLLLDEGADVNMCGTHGTALLQAAYHGDLDIVNQLLKYGADVNCRDSSCGGPLQAAIIGGNHEVVKLLLERGADINAQPGKYRAVHGVLMFSTSLAAAINRGDAEMFDLLLNKGASVDLQTGNLAPALHVAVGKRMPSMLIRLLRAGANIEIEHQGMTPLAQAIYIGDVLAARELLEAGANANHDLTLSDSIYRTLLDYAISERQEEILKLLLEFGANANALSDVGQKSNEPPLHRAADIGSLSVAKILLEHGADCNWQNDTGWTAAHLAARERHPEILRLLCDDYHANLLLRLANGSLPLHSAAAGGEVTCIEMLLSRPSVNVNVRNHHGRTPLHFAVENGHPEAVKTLLASGARVDAEEEETGMTPLDYAAMEARKFSPEPEVVGEMVVGTDEGMVPWNRRMREILKLLENAAGYTTKAKGSAGVLET